MRILYITKENANHLSDEEFAVLPDNLYGKKPQYLCFTLKSYFPNELLSQIYACFRQAFTGLEGFAGPEKSIKINQHQLLVIGFYN